MRSRARTPPGAWPELAERVGAMRGELDALHERAERGARLGSVLSAAGWPTLLDTLAAPGEAWAAIEAVVGGELEQALVWREDDFSGSLADARGTARLLLAEPESDGAEQRRQALAAVQARQTVAEWIAQPAAPRILQRAVLAPDLPSLLDGWRRLPDGWVAVTAEGDVADSRGLVSVRGRGDAEAGEAARRHARRRELSEALARLEAEQEAAGADAAREMAAVGEAARRLDVARSRRDATEASSRAAAEARDAAQARRRRVAEEMELLGAEIEAIAPIGADAEPPADAAHLGELERSAAAAREARVAAAAGRDRSRDAWMAAQSAARQVEERQVGQRQELAMLEARQAQLTAALPAQRQAVTALAGEHGEAGRTTDAAREADEAAAAERAEADAKREAARAALLEVERQAGGGSAHLAELEREAQRALVEASRREEAMAALAREREAALDSLPEAEDGSPAEADDPQLTAELGQLDDEALDSEQRRVRRTLAQIGSVNPFAVEEHAEMAGRLEELTGQDGDLTTAIESTEELIARLDADIGQQFNAAFAAIGERFDEFCRLLFAGGSASLQLSDGSDGEAPGGIEIVVRPPGKRLQRLAMLSGGERALTGVALLFAMLSVNPVPFCILDEVDAALDEANIGRFADALRKLSESIDFVVITHNRATIEVADTIYGVTMTDAAVSRIVSLRLADLPAEAMA